MARLATDHPWSSTETRLLLLRPLKGSTMMTLLPAWQLVSAEIIFALGGLIMMGLARRFGTPIKRALLLYGWHTIFCFVAISYTLKNGGDALGYYHTALQGGTDFRAGTDAINFITVPFVSTLHLSFYGTNLVYQILGAIGLLAFDASLRTATTGRHRYVRLLATVTVVLPSISYWSSLIGKDAISFLATSLALWAALNMGRRVWLMILSVALMLLVRPHIAGIIVMALAGSFVVKRKVPPGRRLALGAAAIAASIAIVPYALDYAGLGEGVDASELAAYIEQRQQGSENGMTSVDLSAMSPPAQLFTYMFRPLPFEVGGIFGFAASFDNMMLMVLCTLGIWNMVRHRLHDNLASGNRTFMWIYVVLTWTVLAVTTSNLGTSLRQKWMVAPILIFLLLSRIGRVRVPQTLPAISHPPAAELTTLPQTTKFPTV